MGSSDETLCEKVKLTPKVLEDVNSFSRLNLSKDRCYSKSKAVNCFSDPVIVVRTCNPSVPDENGETGMSPDVCSIYHVCSCYFAARLGIGLNVEDSYDFDKALSYAKSITWPDLLKLIKLKLKGNLDSSEEVVEEEPEEEIQQQTKNGEEETSMSNEESTGTQEAVSEETRSEESKNEELASEDKKEAKSEEKKSSNGGGKGRKKNSRSRALEMGLKEGVVSFYVARAVIDNPDSSIDDVVKLVLENKWTTRDPDKIKATLSSLVQEGKLVDKDGKFSVNPSV
jgi:hypothetical protein